MALKEKTVKVYETSDGKIFPADKRKDAKNHQQSLDVEALKKKLEKRVIKIFLAEPLVREEFVKINNLLELDYPCMDDVEDELEEFENIIQGLFAFLVDLFNASPHKMRILTRMIDGHLEGLLD